MASNLTSSEQLMKDVVEAWGRADLAPFKAAVHDDIVWRSAATTWNDRLRSGGVHRGKPAVMALLSKISTAFFNTHSTAREIVSKGEIVWGLFDYEAVYRPVGEPDRPARHVQFETAYRMRIHDGKIIEWQSFFDTLGLLEEIAGPARA